MTAIVAECHADYLETAATTTAPSYFGIGSPLPDLPAISGRIVKPTMFYGGGRLVHRTGPSRAWEPRSIVKPTMFYGGSIAHRTLISAAWEPDIVVGRVGIIGLGHVRPAVADVVISLARLSDLDEDWDGYGAREIDIAAIETAANFVSAEVPDDLANPAVVPTSRGGVQIEWHECGVDLEVQFDSPTAGYWTWEDVATGETQEGDVNIDRVALRERLNDLAHRKADRAR